jgi:hypothetical protein
MRSPAISGVGDGAVGNRAVVGGSRGRTTPQPDKSPRRRSTGIGASLIVVILFIRAPRNIDAIIPGWLHVA